MNWDLFISYLNFVSRWYLFIAVAYKAYQTRDKAWVLLSAALFINALDVESYILSPLGIQITGEVYDVVSQLPNFYIAVLLFWGALHLKYGTSRLMDTVLLSTFVVESYVWMFLVAAGVFQDNFALKTSFPLFAYSSGLVYFGKVLREREISGRGIESLFPWGMMLLGLLNFTYPFIRNVEELARAAFFLAALFRLSATVGALKFVFIPIPEEKVARAPTTIMPGAFIRSPREGLDDLLGDTRDVPNLVLITREGAEAVKEKLHPNALVFWVTRIAEGEVLSSPRVYAISPTRIDILTDLVAKAIDRGYRVLYVDALEYLVVENGFESTLKFLLNVKDRVLVANGTMVLIVDPEALKPSQRRILEREFQGG
ncbi:hypothetical protein A3L12_06220 [Thermococcus sp. P6]|uniref:DUF835 domain-containing protein n=1 Tax=Thermococcus sp. P6 TaxID=122420 RepID=UPI000B59DBFF|nr:DUF835 domain-containing protein [Thermococcus sp. P6]ASJ10923.1 hypothetical protein A3L12_06220 [Thermococcus sp. P6]